MSLFPVIPTTAYPQTGYNLPDLISICVQDADGTGGTLYLNGVGVVNGVDIFDLKTLFTNVSLPFSSYPLLRAFRSVPAATGNASALAQFSKNLEINYYPIVGVADPAFALRFQPIAGIGGGPATAPYLQIVVPAGGEEYAGDVWRLNLKLRHSITN